MRDAGVEELQHHVFEYAKTLAANDAWEHEMNGKFLSLAKERKRLLAQVRQVEGRMDEVQAEYYRRVREER